MSVVLPVQEVVDDNRSPYSSRAPSDAELSYDDKQRRQSPKSRSQQQQGGHEDALLRSEYATATEMVCSSNADNGGVESAYADNTGDWKNTVGGNKNRFHPIWGPPVLRKGMILTIGNGRGGAGEHDEEWDPFFGPPVRKSRGVPQLSDAILRGDPKERVGMVERFHWEGLDQPPPQVPALIVPYQLPLSQSGNYDGVGHPPQIESFPPAPQQRQQVFPSADTHHQLLPPPPARSPNILSPQPSIELSSSFATSNRSAEFVNPQKAAAISVDEADL